MKRVVKLDDQIDEGRCFAIYDTVRERFDSVNGSHRWDTADELAQDYDHDIADITQNALSSVTNTMKQRLREEKVRCVGLAKSAGY